MIDTDMIKALRCLASQDAEGNCYEDIYNLRNHKQEMHCGGNLYGSIPCPYYQNKYEVCFEDGECGEWLDTVADKLEKLLKKKGWIPVEEYLPDEGGMYLVTAKENGLYHTTFVKWQSRYKKWDLTGARTYWKVIAWMPLPEQYRPEE